MLRLWQQLYHCLPGDEALGKVLERVNAEPNAHRALQYLVPHAPRGRPTAGPKKQRSPTQRVAASDCTEGHLGRRSLRVPPKCGSPTRPEKQTKSNDGRAPASATINVDRMLDGSDTKASSTTPQCRATYRFAYAKTDSCCNPAGKSRRSSPSSGRSRRRFGPSRKAQGPISRRAHRCPTRRGIPEKPSIRRRWGVPEPQSRRANGSHWYRLPCTRHELLQGPSPDAVHTDVGRGVLQPALLHASAESNKLAHRHDHLLPRACESTGPRRTHLPATNGAIVKPHSLRKHRSGGNAHPSQRHRPHSGCQQQDVPLPAAPECGNQSGRATVDGREASNTTKSSHSSSADLRWEHRRHRPEQLSTWRASQRRPANASDGPSQPARVVNRLAVSVARREAERLPRPKTPQGSAARAVAACEGPMAMGTPTRNGLLQGCPRHNANLIGPNG